MANLKEIEEELQAILSNCVKSKNRPYSEKTIGEKRQRIRELLEKAEEIDGKVVEHQVALKIKEAFGRIKATIARIEEALKEHEAGIRTEQTKVKMVFDIKTATSLLQPYSGKHEETETFIGSMELLDEITEAENKTVMIKFIKTRITGKAKYVITDEVTTVAQIKAKLLEKFSTRLSSDAVMAQLKTCQQGNRKIIDFVNQIESLSSQLARAFIAENIATGEAAEKLAEKFAIQAFTNNVASSETALIIKAGTHKTLSEVTAKAITVDKPQPSGSILHYNTRPNNRPQGNLQNRRQANSASRRPQQGYRPGNQWFQRGNNTNQSRDYRNNSNYSSRPGYNNSYRNNSNRYNNNQDSNRRDQPRRVHHIQESGEFQTPQPESEELRLGEMSQEYIH